LVQFGKTKTFAQRRAENGTNHIYKQGQTYHFFEVTDFKPTTTGFSFTYTGKATGVTRKAVFNNTSTAGYALV
jgi:hypothetical protein